MAHLTSTGVLAVNLLFVILVMQVQQTSGDSELDYTFIITVSTGLRGPYPNDSDRLRTTQKFIH